MGNLFDRLAGRALGVVPVAQPLLALSTTAASGADKVSTAVEESRERVRPSLESSSPAVIDSASPAPLPRDYHDEDPIAIQRSPTLPAPAVTDSALPKASVVEPATATTLVVTAISTQQRSEQSTPAVAIEQSRSERESLALARSETRGFTESPQIERVAPHIRPAVELWRPLRRESADRAAEGRAQSEASAPVIRVSIGRVDVRAQFPAPASPRPAPRSKKATPLSLEEYARQRSEGRR